MGKHNVHTHFPKHRNCEICKRTKITRAPCRRRNGEAVPRAVNFGDLITADHKVLSDNCESRNNHRYAVVVQDLATQWIQAYPCKTKTSQETQRSLQKFLEPDRNPKVIYTDNSLEFGKACEDLSWNHCTSTPHRSETNEIAERAVRRVKEGTSPTGSRSLNARQLGCVFQDMKPQKSTLWKSSDMQKPVQRVKFTKAIARHTKIRDQNPSLGYICPGEPHQRNPNAPKFEDRSQEETERQKRCALDAAWKFANNILKLKEKDKTAFFSPSKNRCLLAPSNLKPEERDFVVDSGASMQMISKKDLNSADLETVTTSRSATAVMTANGEVQTNEDHSLCERIGCVLDNESPREYASSLIARKALR